MKNTKWTDREIPVVKDGRMNIYTVVAEKRYVVCMQKVIVSVLWSSSEKKSGQKLKQYEKLFLLMFARNIMNRKPIMMENE